MSARLNIEFQRVAKPRWVGWALLAIAVFLIAEVDMRKQELAEEIAVWKGGSTASTKIQANMPAVEDQAKEAGVVIEQLALPWSPLFGSLERAHSENVALLSVQPDAQRRSVTLTGEAKGYADVLGYVSRLKSEAKLGNVYLVSNELKEEQPQRPVGFTITADWKGLQ